jgi:hypothetical protein
MNHFHKLRYQTRVALLLAVLLSALLLNNIAGRASFNRMEQTAAAIYEDRLMPATYLFELREHLEAERELSRATEKNTETEHQQEQHRLAIADIITRYEKTELTPEERSEWRFFRHHLELFQAAGLSQAGASRHFEQSIRSLNHLSLIQAGEGKHLRADMHQMVSSSALMSYFEFAIILVIGGITLSLIGFSKSMFEQSAPHSPSLN